MASKSNTMRTLKEILEAKIVKKTGGTKVSPRPVKKDDRSDYSIEHLHNSYHTNDHDDRYFHAHYLIKKKGKVVGGATHDGYTTSGKLEGKPFGPVHHESKYNDHDVSSLHHHIAKLVNKHSEKLTDNHAWLKDDED